MNVTFSVHSSGFVVHVPHKKSATYWATKASGEWYKVSLLLTENCLEGGAYAAHVARIGRIMWKQWCCSTCLPPSGYPCNHPSLTWVHAQLASGLLWRQRLTKHALQLRSCEFCTRISRRRLQSGDSCQWFRSRTSVLGDLAAGRLPWMVCAAAAVQWSSQVGGSGENLTF